MKRNVRYVAALFVLGLCATASQAQFGTNTGGGRPAVSPYLNLFRGGDPAINYYGLVRPQIAAGKNFDQLGLEFNTLQSGLNQAPQSGHVSSFMTQSRYFMTNNGASRQAATKAVQAGGSTGNPASPTGR